MIQSLQGNRTSPPYYEYAISNFKTIQNMPNFPILSTKEIYQEIRRKGIPRVENKHQMKKWKDIWKNLRFKYIPIMDRNIMYKFIHEILPTNEKLYQMRIRDSPNCNYCQTEETNIHKFQNCIKMRKSVQMIKRKIEYLSNMRFQNIENLLYLEIPNIQKKNRNSIMIIIANFITCTWFNRETPEFMEEKIISKVIREKEFLLTLLKEKANRILSKKYCDLTWTVLESFRS